MQPFHLAWILLLGLLWGTPYALTKISLETIPPLTLVAGRVAIAAMVLWLVALSLRRAVPVTGTFVGLILIQGVLSCVVPYTLLAFGQQSVDSGLAAILNSTAPLFVCLISFWWSLETLTARRLFGVASGFAGVIGVAGASAMTGLGQQTVDQGLIVLAALSSALSAIHGRRFVAVAPEVVAAATLTSAALILLPFSLLFEMPWRLSPSSSSIVALFVNALFATALGFVVYFRLLSTIGSIGTASTSYLKPAVGALIGVAFLGEAITWPLIIALITILCGIFAITTGQSGGPSDRQGTRPPEPLSANTP